MIAKRASSISSSLTLAITAKAKKMKADGIHVYPFGAGEPDFDTPDYIVAAAKAALDAGHTKYTPSSGILPLKQAICKKFKTDNGIEYEPSQIVVSNGAKHSLFNAMQALVDEGDEVIIPAPYWLTYPELVRLSQGTPIFVETDELNGFKLTPDALKAAITEKTKVIILNSPSNPTGSVYSCEELQALGKILKDSGIYVVSDEIYEELVYGVEFCSFLTAVPEMYDRTVVVNGLSKTYSMTGWRIGYLAAPKEIAAAIDNMQSHTTSNANSIAQYAALAALTTESDFLTTMQHEFNERRMLMVNRLRRIPLVSCIEPRGAFYVMLNIKKLIGKSIDGIKIDSAHILAELLLSKACVAAVPGEAFGAPDFLRFSYAISREDIENGLDALHKFIEKLR